MAVSPSGGPGIMWRSRDPSHVSFARRRARGPNWFIQTCIVSRGLTLDAVSAAASAFAEVCKTIVLNGYFHPFSTSLSVTPTRPRVETLKRYQDSVHPERQLCVSLLEVGRGWGGSLAGPTTDPANERGQAC